MAEHQIISIRNRHPEWEYPTYEFEVLLDADKTVPVVEDLKDRLGRVVQANVETGAMKPDPEWVRVIEVSTCPSYTEETADPNCPQQQAATKGLGREELLKTVAHRVAALKHDLERNGVIPHAEHEVSLDEFLSQKG